MVMPSPNTGPVSIAILAQAPIPGFAKARLISAIALTTFPFVLIGQFFEPEGAHVNLYFPHLADGGTAAQQWRTSFVFVNPHTMLTASVSLSIYGDDGRPLVGFDGRKELGSVFP